MVKFIKFDEFISDFFSFFDDSDNLSGKLLERITLTNLHVYQDLSDLFEGFRIEPTAYPDHPSSLQTSAERS